MIAIQTIPFLWLAMNSSMRSCWVDPSPGIPIYRTRVQYVPQRPSLLPGTPIDFLATVRTFNTRQTPSTPSLDDPGIDPIELASSWGIDKILWKREWGALSGGEGQRIALAIAVGLGGADVILLDGE